MWASLKKSLIVAPLYWLNGLFPGAKKLVPKWFHRFVLLRIVGVNRGYETLINHEPSRLFLEREVMPWVADHYHRVLFVGAASYTYHYERTFRDDPGRYTTMDRLALTRVWGADQHIVGPIQEIDRHRPAGFFDCVVLNGVLGYRIPEWNETGIVEIEDMRTTMKVLHHVIRPDGMLVLGWNPRDMAKSPMELGVMQPFFEPTDQPPWGWCKRFEGELRHVYEFYRRRGD